MNKNSKEISEKQTSTTAYRITGNGVVHVRASDILKSEKAQKQLESIETNNKGE